jgi:hypothetical protein
MRGLVSSPMEDDAHRVGCAGWRARELTPKALASPDGVDEAMRLSDALRTARMENQPAHRAAVEATATRGDRVRRLQRTSRRIALTAVTSMVIRIAISVAILLAAVACGASESSTAPEQDARSDAPSDAALDTSGDGTTDTSDAACHQLGYLGDEKYGSDSCWAPPEHYCSAVAAAGVTRACAPDGSYCCRYSTTCVACGLVECHCGDTGCTVPNCDTIPDSTDPSKCPLPDATRPICLDGRDAASH